MSAQTLTADISISRSETADVEPCNSQHCSPTPYFCLICYDDCVFDPSSSVNEGYQLPGCKHIFCKECLRSFLRTEINEARVAMKCFSTQAKPQSACAGLIEAGSGDSTEVVISAQIEEHSSLPSSGDDDDNSKDTAAPNTNTNTTNNNNNNNSEQYLDSADVAVEQPAPPCGANIPHSVIYDLLVGENTPFADTFIHPSTVPPPSRVKRARQDKTEVEPSAVDIPAGSNSGDEADDGGGWTVVRHESIDVVDANINDSDSINDHDNDNDNDNDNDTGSDASVPREIVDADTEMLILYQKYERFRFFQTEKLGRECPSCNHLQVHSFGGAAPSGDIQQQSSGDKHSAEEEPSPVSDNVLHCTESHECVHLRLRLAPSYPDGCTVACSVCKRTRLERLNTGYYHCQQCQYDCCGDCSKSRLKRRDQSRLCPTWCSGSGGSGSGSDSDSAAIISSDVTPSSPPTPTPTASDEENKVVCTHCGTTYCFLHGGAHLNSTCSEYTASIAEQVNATTEVISTISKPCPGCGLPIEKSGGCNHMKCNNCNTAFCWVCGKQIDDDTFPAHFQWWNPSGCVNMQMDESVTPTARSIGMQRALSIVQIILFGPLSFITTIISMLACCGCLFFPAKVGCACTDTTHSPMQVYATLMTIYGGFWMFLLGFVPLAIVLLGISIACGIIYYPCYASKRIYHHQYPWNQHVQEWCDWMSTCCSGGYRCLVRACGGETADDINHGGQRSTKAMPFHCKAGHVCVHMQENKRPAVYSIGSRIICDLCGDSSVLSHEAGYYHCSECRYDACVTCVTSQLMFGSQEGYVPLFLRNRKRGSDGKFEDDEEEEEEVDGDAAKAPAGMDRGVCDLESGASKLVVASEREACFRGDIERSAESSSSASGVQLVDIARKGVSGTVSESTAGAGDRQIIDSNTSALYPNPHTRSESEPQHTGVFPPSLRRNTSRDSSLNIPTRPSLLSRESSASASATRDASGLQHTRVTTGSAPRGVLFELVRSLSNISTSSFVYESAGTGTGTGTGSRSNTPGIPASVPASTQVSRQVSSSSAQNLGGTADTYNGGGDELPVDTSAVDIV